MAFEIISESMTPDDLEKIMGHRPDRARTGNKRSPRLATWELIERGGPEDHLQDMIERLLARIDPLRERILAARKAAEASCLLQIVQCEAGPTGPAFWISAESIAMLAELGVDIDVDQYFLSYWEEAGT